tara:strand:+ start:169 stop:573 length:405 start_codon:yes stop_codon:yes gene_type:complete
MAYISQEDKKTLAPAIKAVFKKYGLKGSISIKNHITLCANVSAGRLDLIGAANLATNVNRPLTSGYYQANAYGATNPKYKDINIDIFNFYEELKKAMRGALWFDKSDLMTDYHHTAYFMDINIGRWNKPYQLIT